MCEQAVNLACSTMMHRFCTTFIPRSSSIFAASSLYMPSWNHTYFGCGCICSLSNACSTRNSGLRKILTISTGSISWVTFIPTACPKKLFSGQFRIHTKYPVAMQTHIQRHFLAKVSSSLAPITAIVSDFSSISLINSILYYSVLCS